MHLDVSTELLQNRARERLQREFDHRYHKRLSGWKEPERIGMMENNDMVTALRSLPPL